MMASTPLAVCTKPKFLIENFKKSSDILSSLSMRYEQLLASEKYYDCVFLIGEHEVRCHKLILATASPVFEAMFYGPISEKQNIIEILDMSYDIFKLMIVYIYKGLLDFCALTLEETIELYYGAEKYLLNELKLECLDAIQLKLRFSNILAALELSICLDLSSLLSICFNFFTRCCLKEAQFVAHLKTHYYHVSKDCIKTIISMCKEQIPAQNLLWFIYEWCQQECEEMGLKQTECSTIIEDLNLKDSEAELKHMDNDNKTKLKPQYSQSLERCYYKACRPFTVDYDNCEWATCIKSNRFISLQGLTLHSRLTPHLTRFSIPSDYLENMIIEITAPTHDDSLMWSHTVSKQLTKYNCDVNVKWAEGIVLSPDIEYQIKLLWHPSQSQGAEYPCSLFSSQVEGIQFRDLVTHSGSLIKGIHFVNLV
ncbi:BTB/POZ domain-containing protein 6 [Stomoxys calcitrans]|uniref:BTB domain-containing protein n=1 Tax=Stomoxys calcitrans TaxID=35570 RepID=A0A1I8P1L4_STOCA|nr:BTB/POZ domain-containing protein 6 [Stomoxys calcitrans]